MIGTLLHRLTGPADARSPRQVRRDVEDEIAHHLDALRDELRETGVEEARIDAAAARRFGDPRRYADTCTRIALKERIMLQRINFALLILVGVAVIGLVPVAQLPADAGHHIRIGNAEVDRCLYGMLFLGSRRHGNTSIACCCACSL